MSNPIVRLIIHASTFGGPERPALRTQQSVPNLCGDRFGLVDLAVAPLADQARVRIRVAPYCSCREPPRGTPSGWHVMTGSYLFVHMSSCCTLSQYCGL